MDFAAYIDKAVSWLAGVGPRLLVLMIGAFALTNLANYILRRAFDRVCSRSGDSEFKKRIETLSSVARYAVGLTVLVVASIMALKTMGVDIGPVLAAAGVVGLAVGFGAQNLVKDVISGFFILMDDQVRVGDVVEVGGKSGLVERVNLRMTVLRDLGGNVHFVRNGKIDIVTNKTKEYSRYVFDVGVSYREDVDEVISVIHEVDEALRSDPEYGPLILEPIEVMGLEQFADSAVVIRARTKTRPIEQWRVGREFNRRLKKRFDEKGIEIPFPHVTLYMGQGKDGSAPPLNIRREGQG
jgi:small conductance mechanosensitive channel